MVDDRRRESGQGTQPTVLVSGQASELLRRIPLQILAERCTPGDGAIVVSTREDPAFVARRLLGAVGTFDGTVVAAVDATSKSETTLTRPDDLRWHVPSPVAFGHVGTAVDAAREELRARGVDRVHLLSDTLTVQFRLADADAVHQHAHDIAMAVGGDRGLGLFTLAPSVTTDEDFEGVRHLVDVHVAVRRTANGPEVRWTGLLGSSDGWVALSEAGFRFDALGTSIG